MGPKQKQFVAAKELLHNIPLPLVVPPLAEQQQLQQQLQQQQQAAALVQYPNQAQMLGQPEVPITQPYDPNLLQPTVEQQSQQESIFPTPPMEVSEYKE